MTNNVEVFINDLLEKIIDFHSKNQGQTCINQGVSNSELHANEAYILQRVNEALSGKPISIETFDIGKIAINVKTKSHT